MAGRPRARPRPRVVALVGIDGAGKTTQARMLASWLVERGVPARSFRNAGGRLLLDRLARRLGHRDARHLLGPAFAVVETAVRGLAIARALAVARLTGRLAVMDRYTYCQYATIRARSDPAERWARAALGRFPCPDLVCLLVVPPVVAWRRVHARGVDHEELGYLVALDAAYRALPESPRFRLVDASGDLAAVQTRLRSAVTGTQPAIVPWRSDPAA